MQKIKLVIIDPAGIHARPASVIVAVASKFDSEIFLNSENKKVNLKSIMNVMACGIKKDTEIEISAEGDDAKEAIEAIAASMKENNLI